ncbi:MAG: tetratricopeptide repeat protein [Pseudomonadota bacterium]
MPQTTDRFGGTHTTSSSDAVAAFSDAVFAVLAHRAASDQLKSALDHDPDLVAAHALKGLGSVLLGKAENFQSGAKFAGVAKEALRRVSGGTATERALVEALEFAVVGALSKAAERLERHVSTHPHDLLPLKLSNALRFMCGDREIMLSVTGDALRQWKRSMPGHGFLLGLHAFGLEECGQFDDAEDFGRRSVQEEPADSWGIHAVGHVLEMRGRTDEGIAWFEASRSVWPQCNNFAYHLAWHLALFQLEARDYDRVLALYDAEIRPSETDDFRDMANAVSILWRLEQEGVNVGARWQGLYEIALKRRADTHYVFASLHYLLALLAAGDDAAAAELVAAMAASDSRGDEQSGLATDLGLDIATVLLRLKGGPRHALHQTDHDCGVSRATLERMLRDMPAIGGSHAQRDVFVRSLLLLTASANDKAAFDTVSRARHSFRKQDRYDGLVRTRLMAGALEPARELMPDHGVH